MLKNAAQKKKKKKARFDPFQENLDHIEDLALRYMHNLIRSVKLPQERALAYRIAQIIESNGINQKDMEGFDDSFYLVFDGLSEAFPKARRDYEATLKKQKRAEDLDPEDALDPYIPFYEDLPDKRFHVPPVDWKQIKKWFADSVKALPARGPDLPDGTNPSHDNLMRLADYLNLTKDERTLLEFAFVTKTSERMTQFLTELVGDRDINIRTPMRKCISRCTGIPLATLGKLIGAESKLYKKALFTNPDFDEVEEKTGLPSLENGVYETIQQPGITQDTLITQILGPKRKASLDLENFTGLGRRLDVLKNFVAEKQKSGEGATILLVSDPGIGKSELIEALCKHLDIDLYIPGAQDAGTPEINANGNMIPAAQVRYMAWLHGQGLLSADTINKKGQKTSALFIDEIGEIVGSGKGERQKDGSYGAGALSRLHTHSSIDYPGVITFLAGNNEQEWDEAFLSRIDKKIILPDVNAAYRHQIWQTQLRIQNKAYALSDDQVNTLANDYALTPRMIAKAVKAISAKRGNIDQVLEHLYYEAEMMYPGGIEDLKVDTGPKEAFYPELLAPQNMTSAMLLERMARAKDRPISLHIAGPDGTGKRLLAAQFSQLAGKPLRHIAMPDLIGQGLADTKAMASTAMRRAAEDGHALHISGMEAFISASTQSNPIIDTMTRALAAELRNPRVPVVLTSRFEHLHALNPDISTAFMLSAQLDYLDDKQIALAANRFGGIDGPVHTHSKNITPADIADALRQLNAQGLPQDQLGTLIDHNARLRQGQSNIQIGFNP